MSKALFLSGLLLGTLLLAACGSDESDSKGVVAGQTQAPAEAGGAAGSNETRYGPQRVDDRVAIPDWFPADIYLPDDFQATQALTIGTRTYLLRGITQEAAAPLKDRYYEKLAAAGYDVMDREKIVEDDVVVFDEKGIESGNLRIRDDGDRREMQFSMTMDTR